MTSPGTGPDAGGRGRGLRFTRAPALLDGQYLFLSASIPHRSGWEADPLEITEAVLAAVRAILGAGGRIVYGGHPAIASVMLSAVADIETVAGPPVIVFQSELYEDLIPEATWDLVRSGAGEMRVVPKVEGELPEFGKNLGSLVAMREAMLDPEAPHRPVAGLFVGGMEGVHAELRLFRNMFPGVPVYPIGGPGAAARQLAEDVAGEPFRMVSIESLRESRDYGSLMDDVLADLTRRL